MRSVGRIIRDIWRLVKFELLSTFGSLLTIVLATILPGMFWVAHKNMTLTEEQLKSSMTVNVYLQDKMSLEQIITLQKEFSALGGVRSANYVSKEDALAQMKQRFGAQMLEGMENDNPLPASFVLNVDQSIIDPGQSEALLKKLRSFPGVDDVVFAGEILTRLGKIMRAIEVLGLAFSILVAFAAIFIVANTVRVAISERRKTVEIMQLVGATRGFILTPFVLLGGILGLAGAALSTAGLFWMTGYVSKHLFKIAFLEPYEMIAFLLIGLLLGMVGALTAAQRYLKI